MIHLPLQNFNIHHVDFLVYSDASNRPGLLCYNFFSKMTLRLLAFPLIYLFAILTALLFPIYFLLLILAFGLQFPSVYWEIFIKVFPQCPLVSILAQKVMLFSIKRLLLILLYIPMVFSIILEMFCKKIYVILMLLFQNFASRFILKINYISLNECI